MPESWEDEKWRIIYHRDSINAIIAINLETREQIAILCNGHNFALNRLRNHSFTPTKLLSEPLLQRYLRKLTP